MIKENKEVEKTSKNEGQKKQEEIVKIERQDSTFKMLESKPVEKKKTKKRGLLHKILLAILALVIVAIIFFVVLGVGIYWFNWQNNFVLNFPYPASMVNWHLLKYSDYINDLRTLDFFYNAEAKVNPQVEKPSSDQLKESVLTRMIKDQFLQQKAKLAGISVTAADIDQEWQNIVQQAGSEATVLQTLKEIYNWDASQFKTKVIEPYILRSKMQQKIAFDDTINAEAKKKAEEVLALVKEGKQTFEDLAKQYSEDTTTASQGGDLGYFAQGDMVKEFEDAVLKLKPGETSGIVQTEYGYHIIKLVDETAATEDQSEQFHAEHILFKAKTIDEWVNQEIAKVKVYVFARGFHWEKSCTTVLQQGGSCDQQ